jgi:hypothetical protein
MNLNLKNSFVRKAAPLLILTSLLGACASQQPCSTTVVSTGGRTFYGNNTTTWSGNETMVTACQYKGNNPPSNWNAPGHLGHMQGQKGNNGSTGWFVPK